MTTSHDTSTDSPEPAESATSAALASVEPPLAGTAVEHLVASLERLRATFRWKADGLDADGLALRIGASSLTLGNLLKHLALVEDVSFAWKLAGRSPGTGPGEAWAEADFEAGDWEFTSAAQDTPEQLYALWDGAVRRSRERLRDALAQGGLDLPTHQQDGDGHHPSLRRLLFDLVEEYGRHTGHADLLREAVDGVVGEDPPQG